MRRLGNYHSIFSDKIIEIDGRGEKKLDHNVTSHYLTIPVAEKFYPTGSGFYLELGPQLGILLSKKATIGGGDSYTPFKDDNRTLDFGILGGVGNSVEFFRVEDLANIF